MNVTGTVYGNMGWRSFTIRDIADGSGSPTDWTDLGTYRVNLIEAKFRLSGHFKVSGYGASPVQFRVNDTTDGVILAYINQRADGGTADYGNYYYLYSEGTTSIGSGWHVIKIQYKESHDTTTTSWKNLQLEYRY